MAGSAPWGPRPEAAAGAGPRLRHGRHDRSGRAFGEPPRWVNCGCRSQRAFPQGREGTCERSWRREATSLRADRRRWPLPFDDQCFDLVLCVSVLEYIHKLADRQAFVAEMRRATKDGGFIFLATPNPLRLRDYHTKRWLGDFRKVRGYPWACTPWQVQDLFAGFEKVQVGGAQVRLAMQRLGVPGWLAPRIAWAQLRWVLPWQRVLMRKPA